MKRKNRICCMMLAVCILLAMLPVFTYAAEEEAVGTSTDFVLVMDCSGTMLTTDPNGLCAAACKMFIDLVPIQNARVSVIAFGYESNTDTKGFVYSSDFQITVDNHMVHQIVPLSEVATVNQKVNFKYQVDEVSKEHGRLTPIGQALAAAVDVLVQNKATNKNACVILLTDGVLTSTNADKSWEWTTQAATVAADHEWPIYCIELDFRNENYEGSPADKLMNSICAISGAGEDGRMKVTSPADVCEAFLKIFNNFMSAGSGNIEPWVIGESGVAEKTFIVPNLVSEANIVVSGAAVDQVEVINVDDNTVQKISSNVDDDKLKATVEKGSYFCIKMICPKAGNWMIRAHGDPDAQILVYNSSMQEMALKMVANPSRTGEILHKDDVISVDAFFTYQGNDVHKNTFYGENPAYLYVACRDGIVRTFEMNGTEDGYHLDLKVGDVPSGDFQIHVGLENTIFRNGKKESNSASFTSENRPLDLLNEGITVLHGYVNGRLDRVDLTKIFDNPDGDQITYELSCISDRSIQFEYGIDETGYLVIESGLVAGTFDVELRAVDPDMTEALVHPMTLEIVDRKIICNEFPKVQLWVDRYPFQKEGVAEAVIDLRDYFNDPDGVEITYTLGEVDDSILKVTRMGTELHLSAVGEGKASLVIKADDCGEPVTAELEVRCTSGQRVFWAKNGVWFALGLGVLLAVVILISFVYKNTKVKGTWNISFEQNGYCATAESVNFAILSIGKKQKFKLKDLVNEVGRFVEDSNDVMANVSNFFMDKQACQIELKGVFSGKGFVVQKIPECDTISVTYIGRSVSKKVKVTSGYIVFKLCAPGEYGTEELNITIQAAEMY